MTDEGTFYLHEMDEPRAQESLEWAKRNLSEPDVGTSIDIRICPVGPGGLPDGGAICVRQIIPGHQADHIKFVVHAMLRQLFDCMADGPEVLKLRQDLALTNEAYESLKAQIADLRAATGEEE